MSDIYSARVNPHYDADADIQYAHKFVDGNARIYVVVPDITEEERQKRLRVTLDIMSAISTRISGRQIRYTAETAK